MDIIIHMYQNMVMLFLNHIDQCLYYLNVLNVNIIKVFPIINFNFYFGVKEKKLNQIKFINSFKYDLYKIQNLLSIHIFLNNLDKNSDNTLKLDPLNNSFFFNFNNLTNLADN